MAHRITRHNDGELMYVATEPNGVLDHADFVHPFIAVDYDAAGRLIGFSASGPAIDATLTIHRDFWRDPSMLVEKLAQADDLIAA